MIAPTPRLLRYAGGRLEVDLAARTVRVDGRAVAMTRAEYALTAYLAARPRQLFPRAVLAEQVWPGQHSAAEVTEHIRRIRRRLGALAPISTVQGVCYRWDLPLEAGR